MGLFNKLCAFSSSGLCTFLKIAGPGLVVMLADTDAGSIVTAAQSGAVWGYKLLFLQIILIPILFFIQELTIRLGLVTNKGLGALIKAYLGKFWAWVSVGALIVCCIGALITELSGIVSVGNLFGIAPTISMLITVLFLMLLVLTKSYSSVERIALACGIFELVYLFVAWQAHPSVHAMSQDFFAIPWHNGNYLYLAAANIGAVIMPWMIFYQQSAIADKKLNTSYIKAMRIETAVGAVITQVIMASIIIAIAATLGSTHGSASLDTIEQISQAITPFLGIGVGRVLFALGMLGAALIATIVVLLTAVWSIGEITGLRHTIQNKPRKAPWFYAVYCIILIGSALLVSSNIPLVHLNVAIEVLNALLLPVVLSFLLILVYKVLPSPYALKGWYAVLVTIIIVVTGMFGLAAGLWGAFSI